MNGYQNSMAEHLGAQHLQWVFRRLAINCVLDVGANRGQFAKRLRLAGYTGRIVSYEPVAEHHGALTEAAADDPAWFVNPWALGDQNGTAEINVVPGTMSSMLSASDFGKEWSDNAPRLPHRDHHHPPARGHAGRGDRRAGGAADLSQDGHPGLRPGHGARSRCPAR